MMCPHCGAPTPVHNRFCGRCGAYMAAAPFDATGGETTRPWQTYPAGVGARATVTASPYGDDGDRDAHAYLQPPQFAPPSPPPYGPGPYNVVTPVRDTLVGFGPRFLASLLDGVVLAVVLAVPGLILGAVLAALHASALGGILQSVAVLGYYVYCWSTTGQTVGMKPFHMRVARADGRPLSWGTGFLRLLGYVVATFGFPFLWGVGFLWVIWDPKKQGWHDKIAGTVVVHDRQSDGWE